MTSYSLLAGRITLGIFSIGCLLCGMYKEREMVRKLRQSTTSDKERRYDKSLGMRRSRYFPK